MNKNINEGHSATLEDDQKTQAIRLPDGSLVTEDEFGLPPADLPHDQVLAWYEQRAAVLMSYHNPEEDLE